ncbi:MAG TPA: hypothetical protein VEW69_01995 [Alphaproteobacteria bacterium]|nr:hypothetical protein [Alphaproteobacteria bacterium]
MKNYAALFVLALALALGCNSGSTAPQSDQPKASTPETGRFALQKMIPAARLWNADAQTVRLQSTTMPGNDGHGGKSGFWRATFASVSARKTMQFSWSGLAGPDAPPRGIGHSTEDSYNPGNRSNLTFDLNFLRTDTDNAFQVAQEHGGKQLLEKDPSMTVTYLLDWEAEENQLRWHVIYGASGSLSKLSVVVDASTGAYLRKE